MLPPEQHDRECIECLLDPGKGLVIEIATQIDIDYLCAEGRFERPQLHCFLPV
jgi:hypothetical protein